MSNNQNGTENATISSNSSEIINTHQDEVIHTNNMNVQPISVINEKNKINIEELKQNEGIENEDADNERKSEQISREYQIVDPRILTDLCGKIDSLLEGMKDSGSTLAKNISSFTEEMKESNSTLAKNISSFTEEIKASNSILAKNINSLTEEIKKSNSNQAKANKNQDTLLELIKKKWFSDPKP